MLDGVMLLWFVLAAIALLFVAIDIRTTPESPVLKWGFVLVTAYTGVVGAFLYVLGCREPLPGLHEQYVAARWRQTLGSTMHCVAGDGGRYPRRRCARARFWPHRPARGRSRIRPWFCVRLDGVPGVVHARHVRRLLPPLDRPHLHPGTAVYELADGRHGAHDDDPADAARERRRSDNSGVLVRHVDGTAGRLHRRLSDELVAGTLQSEARHDDGAHRRRTRAQRSHRTRRYGRDAARDGGDGPRGETKAHCPCHDPIVVCRPCGQPGDRLDRRTDVRQILIRDRIGAAPVLHQIRYGYIAVLILLAEA